MPNLHRYLCYNVRDHARESVSNAGENLLVLLHNLVKVFYCNDQRVRVNSETRNAENRQRVNSGIFDTERS